MRARLLDFVRRQIPGAAPELTPTTPLVSSGMLDSVALVRVAAFVEREAGITIPDRDVTAEHFDTVRSIEAYVTARLAT